MPGGCIKDAPPTILCFGPSCHGSRIGQDRPGRLNLGPIALPRALCKTHPRVLKSEAYFRCYGAPKDDLLDQFPPRLPFVSNAFYVPQTSTISRKLTVNNTVLWLVSNCSLVAEIWPFQVWGVRVLHVYACMSRNLYVSTGISRNLHVLKGIFGICRYPCVLACMYMYWISICMYCMYWTTGARKPPQRPQNTLS
jgi:hypothetical protein